MKNTITCVESKINLVGMYVLVVDPRFYVWHKFILHIILDGLIAILIKFNENLVFKFLDLSI